MNFKAIGWNFREVRMLNMKNNRITDQDILDLIECKMYIRMGSKTTVCCIVLKNGFEVIGTSACVDYKNFNKDIGEKIAFEKAFEKIWELEGYNLQCKLYLDKNET